MFLAKFFLAAYGLNVGFPKDPIRDLGCDQLHCRMTKCRATIRSLEEAGKLVAPVSG